MSDNIKELFNNNKITEALCQFTFKEHISPDFYPKFIERVKAKYPSAVEIPLLHFSFNLQNPSPQKSQSAGLKIMSENGEKVVQVFTDNISIHQVGNYQQWEVFREDIYFILDAFQKDISAEIGRIDLRTINVFDFEDQFNEKEYFKVALNYPKELIQQANYHFNLEQIFEQGKSGGVIRGSYIKENDKMKFVLDLSCVNWFLDTKVNSGDTALLKESLDAGHLKLYHLFRSAISDQTKKLIK